MQFNPNSRTDGHTLLKQALTDRSDGEESIKPKVMGMNTADKRAWSKKLRSYNIISQCLLAIELCGLILTHEQTDAHSWNKFYRQIWWREISLEPKVAGVHTTDKQWITTQETEELFSVWWLVSHWVMLTRELTDAHTWNTSSRYIWWRGVHRALSCGCAYDGQTSTVQEAKELYNNVYYSSLANELCSLILTREPMDTHSWSKLYRQIWWRGVHRAQTCGCTYDGQTTTVQGARELYIVYDGLLAIELCSLILTRESADTDSRENL